MTRRLLHALMLASLLVAATQPAQAERIKDLASVAGVRANYLVGYGLVVGLDGTGDQTSQAPFTVQSLKNMLTQLGVVVPPNVKPQLKNVAAVALHAELPPFAKPGQTIDITVSSIGNAKSLRGGSLLMAPLKGADGQVYAIAQGNVVVGGFGVQAADGSRVSINVPSAGRIPNGATVERAVASPFLAGDSLTLQLNTPDFTTARNIAEAVNKSLGDSTAAALDAGTVRVSAPADPSARVGFVAAVENVTLEAGEAPARVIVNSRTGTIVIGGHVRVMPAAVAHGNLTVSITERLNVSQPDRFSSGQTTVTPESTVEVQQDKARMFKFETGVTLDDIVRHVNEVGAAPGDLVAILEALRSAGALRAELIVI